MRTLIDSLNDLKGQIRDEINRNLINGGIIKGKYEIPDYGGITTNGRDGVEELNHIEVKENGNGISTIFFITDENSKIDWEDLTTDDLVYFYEWVIYDDVQITFIRL